MYDIPSDPTIVKVKITEDCVRNGAGPVVERDPEKAVRRARINTGKPGKSGRKGTPAS
jgi:ATP-dependent Clp protease ATP-binding subunit ClpX